MVGAAYATEASGVAEHLLLSGENPSAAHGFFSLEAIAVHPSLRRSGLGTQLLASVAEHSRRDNAARLLLARIEKGDADLIEWYRARGFVICEPDQVLRIGPVQITPSEGHRDSWMDLGRLQA
ncbi:GNAT family N-acetyltransferase [Microbacterium sp. NPDC090007]|uniref:GNAT family N-acetyltransferase n=1 Tax=Microbacterium sp. NPDC090007 TaxID=3364204 RepID=UPI0038145EEE